MHLYVSLLQVIISKSTLRLTINIRHNINGFNYIAKHDCRNTPTLCEIVTNLNTKIYNIKKKNLIYIFKKYFFH